MASRSVAVCIAFRTSLLSKGGTLVSMSSPMLVRLGALNTVVSG